MRYTVIGACRYVEDETEDKLTNSSYAPQWGDVEKVRATFGLSDSTIEQLVQEDESFRRANSDTVEYDLNKVYNHPKVRAFMIKQGSGSATAISYENIIRN